MIFSDPILTKPGLNVYNYQCKFSVRAKPHLNPYNTQPLQLESLEKNQIGTIYPT